MKINETTPLGVFIDNDNAISFGTIIDVEASVDNESDKSLMFASTTFANIKSKVVVLYIYSLYNSEKDVVWAKAKTNEIINLLLEENK